MQIERVGLRENPFHRKGRPTKFVHYRSQQKAFEFLRKILTDDRGIGLLHGPHSSGKSVSVRQFIRNLHTNIAVAVVDGSRLNSNELLSEILKEFGYGVALDTADELLNMLNVFVVQQTRTRQAPLLVLENIDKMFPGALCVLCKLASMVVHKRFALRIVLISDRDIGHIISSPSMGQIAKRMIGDFELEPMTAKETQVYLYAKLRSCGASHPDDVFSFEDCDRLHLASGGWPGKVDGIAMSVIDQAEELPIRLEVVDHSELLPDDDASQLIVSIDGKPSQEASLNAARSSLGRPELNDIISAGGHSLKMAYSKRHVPDDYDDPDLSDTARLQDIVDARRAKTRKELPFIAIREPSS